VDCDQSIKANGKYDEIEGEIRPLGKVLSADYMECKIGSREMYYDVEREMMVVLEDGKMKPIKYSADYRALTKESISHQ